MFAYIESAEKRKRKETEMVKSVKSKGRKGVYIGISQRNRIKYSHVGAVICHAVFRCHLAVHYYAGGRDLDGVSLFLYLLVLSQGYGIVS